MRRFKDIFIILSFTFLVRKTLMLLSAVVLTIKNIFHVLSINAFNVWKNICKMTEECHVL